jgi:hypothetical protein
MGVDEEVVHQLMQEVITGSADVQEVAAEQIRWAWALQGVCATGVLDRDLL